MDEFIVKTKEEKQRVANFIDAIMTHIIENDYYFVDVDGKPTRWGPLESGICKLVSALCFRQKTK